MSALCETRRKGAVALTGTLVLMACGKAAQDATGPEFPELLGRYLGTWVVAVTEPSLFESSCLGAFTVTDQTDSTFTGSYVIVRSSLDCFHESGNFTGTVSADGSVQTPFLRNTPDCTVGGGELTGRLTGENLAVEGVFEVTCDGFDFTLEYSFTGRVSSEAIPGYPDVAGGYTGLWTLVLTGAFPTVTQQCQGSVIVSATTRGELTGTAALGPPCGLTGTLVRTLLTTTGVFSGEINLVVPGCTVAFPPSLDGSFSGRRMVAAGSAALDCNDGLGGFVRVNVAFDFDGER